MDIIPAEQGDSFLGETPPSRNSRNILNSTQCYIQDVEGKGRGVFASHEIPAYTDIETSPVLLFTSVEYEDHGRHTLLDHYTFKWRDGRMALALGLGSLFNHSQAPNVSYRLEPGTESIRYTTTRRIAPDEELCIFYGHSLWFQAVDIPNTVLAEEAPDDEWGGLSRLQGEDEDDIYDVSLTDGDPDDLILEHNLPFTRLKLIDDEAEDELSAVQTEPAWVVDIPDPKYIASLLKWLKQVGYDTPALTHLKRIRKTGSTTTLLLSTVSSTPLVPQLPAEYSLPAPYTLQIPQSAALTQIALQHKTTFWPTIYAPRKKFEPQPWSRAKVRWARDAMRTVIEEANASKTGGDLPIAAHVPVPFDEETREATQMTHSITAHDTRVSTAHPLHHAVLNLVRLVASQRAAASTPDVTNTAANPDDTDGRNGAHYLLTDLTLFLSHEPCIMCSMALLHSRVKEIFYLSPMKKTGGCGSIACLPKLPGVNHRFTIGQWKPFATQKRGLDSMVIEEDIDA
ncbi:cytidine deaminase-like protein [Irpex rosettiformis]|uniref:Cytidine deaminase-like protein n=1 Tax=Irpex rosettiformis TaxID=378272 RepID=A0ACB8TRX7_9APHY|nr:cytidine deaminase-like protein [Irpex rosettiformis]